MPVYVDVDKSGGDAQTLGISSIPSTVVLVNGHETDRIVGAVGTDKFVEWLNVHAVTGEATPAVIPGG